MDASTPPPATPPVEPPAYVYAPGDLYPRTPEEKELCDSASHPDWIYLSGLVVLDFLSIGLLSSSSDIKYSPNELVRFATPAAIGLSVGATFGGTYLSLPKCSPSWVDYPPREGSDRTNWPLALSIATVSALMGPIVTGIAVGPLPLDWSTEERAGHVVVASVAAFGGALLPYLLPPRTWRAAKALEHLRAGADSHGAFVGYAVRF